MCDGIPPVPGWCVGDDLTDDISDDWPPARDLPRVLIQADQGGQIGPYIDHRPVVSPPGKWSTGAAEEGGGNIAFGEEVKGDVGSDLVDTSSVALSFRLSGVPVDPAHGCVGPVGGQVEPVQVGGAGIGRFADHLPFFQFLPITVFGRCRVGGDDQPLDPGS
jgi:hypothetical protein